jgi:N-acetylglucosaminyldiphosphoundecaprenol N-acetyl-beta-D-mannosaminyltransferase
MVIGKLMIDQQKVSILGVGVNPISMNDALATLFSWFKLRRSAYICVTPAHSIMDAYRDSEICRILNFSGLTTPDGMSVVWVLRLLGYKDVERVYGSDLMLKACQFGLPHNWRHYFYGGDEGVAETLVARLMANYPELQVAGTYTPPFRPLTLEEDEEIINTINETEADVVWVGLSSPKQERWMAEHLGKIEAPAMIGVGAAFDFLSGRKPQAPRWIQRSGFEWLFRLATEPRRLWPRYRQYPLFVWLVLLQLLGLKEYPSE